MNTLIAPTKLVPLAPFTTLELGGPAAEFLTILSLDQALEVVGWWRSLPADKRPRVLPLGGGSNLLIADSGFEGLVLKLENKTIQVVETTSAKALVKVDAGVVWDDFVSFTVEKNWSGIECLSGIPGSVGASPVKNIGAYGQEVSETIVEVEGVDLDTGCVFRRNAQECEFSYRDSFFKRAPSGRFLITSVVFELEVDGSPTIRYGELKDLAVSRELKTLNQVRALVLEVRRSKSMVYDHSDPNHRSAGSFFTNPVVPTDVADSIAAKLEPGAAFPRFAAGPGLEKLSAAWLISQSGIPKGFQLTTSSRVGLSTNHVLALTNRGGGTTEELLDLCRHVQTTVRQCFGVDLVPEPVFVGL